MYHSNQFGRVPKSNRPAEYLRVIIDDKDRCWLMFTNISTYSRAAISQSSIQQNEQNEQQSDGFELLSFSEVNIQLRYILYTVYPAFFSFLFFLFSPFSQIKTNIYRKYTLYESKITCKIAMLQHYHGVRQELNIQVRWCCKSNWAFSPFTDNVDLDLQSLWVLKWFFFYIHVLFVSDD